MVLNDNIIRHIILPFIPCSSIIDYMYAFELLDTEIFDKIYQIYGIKSKRKTIPGKLRELAKYSNFLCTNCNKNRGFFKRYIPYNLKLCKECYSLPIYRLISKTIAIKDFHIPKHVLGEFEHIQVCNPYFSTAPPMILYREVDILSYLSKT